MSARSRFLKRPGLCGLFVMLLAGTPAGEAALTITTDHQTIAFGVMQLGEEKRLAQLGSYQNQITCSSTNGQSWSLKMHLLQPLSSGAETIPLDQFTWQATSPNGHGVLASPNQFTPFSLAPQTVYISGADEASGDAVTVQFTYSLRVPDEQVSGIYQTIIRFTLTELL